MQTLEYQYTVALVTTSGNHGGHRNDNVVRRRPLLVASQPNGWTVASGQTRLAVNSLEHSFDQSGLSDSGLTENQNCRRRADVE